MYNIKNHRQGHKFIDIPYLKHYYTNNIILIDHDLLLSRPIKYTKTATTTHHNATIETLSSVASTKRAYQFLNINNEVTLHDTMIYTPLTISNLSNKDYAYDIAYTVWIVYHGGCMYCFDSARAGFILYRVPKPTRHRCKFYIVLSEYGYCGIDRLPTLTITLNNAIIGIVAGLALDIDDIPKPLRIGELKP